MVKKGNILIIFTILIIMGSINTQAQNLCDWANPYGHWNLTTDGNDCSGKAPHTGITNRTFTIKTGSPSFNSNGTTFNGASSMWNNNQTLTSFGTDEFTICANMSFNWMGGVMMAVTNQNNGDNTGLRFGAHTGRPYGSSGSTYDTYSATVQGQGKFYEICMQYNSSHITLYTDGRFNATAQTTGTRSPTGGKPTYLGQSDTSTWYYNGTMKDLTIYYPALTPQNITDRYNKIWLSTPASPNFSITSLNTYNNQSINTFNATINGIYYSTNSGTITTAILQNSTNLHNLTIQSTNMFNYSSTNLNVSSNLQANMSQYPIFIITDSTTNINITNVRIQYNSSNTTTTTNTTYININGTYILNITKTGYMANITTTTINPNTYNIFKLVPKVINATITSPTSNKIYNNYANIYHNYTLDTTLNTETTICYETYIGTTTQTATNTQVAGIKANITTIITDTSSQELYRNFTITCNNTDTTTTTSVKYRYDDLAPRISASYDGITTTANEIIMNTNITDFNLTNTYIQLEDKYNYTNITTNKNLTDYRTVNITNYGIGVYSVTGNATDEAGNILTFTKTFTIAPTSTIFSATFLDGLTGNEVPNVEITDNYLGITQAANPYTSAITNYINKTNIRREINISYYDINLENIPSTQYYNITRQTSVFNYTGVPVKLTLHFYDNGSAAYVNGIYEDTNNTHYVFQFNNTVSLIKQTTAIGKVHIYFGLNYTNTTVNDWIQTYEFYNDGTTDISQDIEIIQNKGNTTKCAIPTILGGCLSWINIDDTQLESFHIQILDSGTGNPIKDAYVRSKQIERNALNQTPLITNQKMTDVQGNTYIIHEPYVNLKLEIIAEGYITYVDVVKPEDILQDQSSPYIIKLIKSGEGVYRDVMVLKPKTIKNDTALIKLQIYAPTKSVVGYVSHKELLTQPNQRHTVELSADKTATIYLYNTENCGNLATFYGLDITEAMCTAHTDEFDSENTTIDIYFDGVYWNDITIPYQNTSTSENKIFKTQIDEISEDYPQYLAIIGFIALIGLAITLQVRFKGRGIGVPVFMIGMIILAFISNIFIIPASIVVIGYIGRWLYKILGGNN